MIRTVALCAGIGGLELGLRAVLPTRVVLWCERDDYCQRVLRARMADGLIDSAPIHGDLTTLDGAEWRGQCDLVAAGFPCQPFSTASRGRRVARDLSGHVLRFVQESGAWAVALENVPGARVRLCELRNELVGMGFCVLPLAEVSSSCVGAAHDRDRLWLLAYAHGNGERLMSLHAEVAGAHPPVPADWRSGPRAEVLGVAHGIPGLLDNRAARLCALGNAVVPAQAALAFGELLRRVP